KINDTTLQHIIDLSKGDYFPFTSVGFVVGDVELTDPKLFIQFIQAMNDAGVQKISLYIDAQNSKFNEILKKNLEVISNLDALQIEISMRGQYGKDEQLTVNGEEKKVDQHLEQINKKSKINFIKNNRAKTIAEFKK